MKQSAAANFHNELTGENENLEKEIMRVEPSQLPPQNDNIFRSSIFLGDSLIFKKSFENTGNVFDKKVRVVTPFNISKEDEHDEEDDC
jgi:hypothetical protein